MAGNSSAIRRYARVSAKYFQLTQILAANHVNNAEFRCSCFQYASQGLFSEEPWVF